MVSWSMGKKRSFAGDGKCRRLGRHVKVVREG
jgi:hypothetical protein